MAWRFGPGPGGYDVRGTARAYCAHLRAAAAARGEGPGSDLASERTRAARVRSDLLELKAAAIRRELIPAGEMERAWSDVLRDVRTRILQIPGRLQAALGLTIPDAEIVEREVRDALTEAGGL